MGRFKVACLGDSLTEGRISYDWVGQLQDELVETFEFHNLGVYGELTDNALQRLEQVHACHPELLLIFSGINDAIACSSEANIKRYTQEQKLTVRPSLTRFEENLNELIESLKNYNLAFINIPPLGDDLLHPANDLVRERNEIIQKLTTQRQLRLLDIHGAMCDYLSANTPEKIVAFRTDLRLMILTMARLEKMGRDWNAISKKYGLVLTTDTIHLNETSGKLLASLVKTHLQQL